MRTSRPKLTHLFIALFFLFLQLFLTYQFTVLGLNYFFPKEKAITFTSPNGTDETEEHLDQEQEAEEATDQEQLSEETTADNESENGSLPQTGDETEAQGNGQEPTPQPEPEPEPPPPPEPTVILCLGDSITYGSPYGGSGSTYPARLQAKLNVAYGTGTTTVINRGIGGYRADQVLASVNAWLASDNPDIVLLKVGGNDLLQETVPQTPEKFLQVVSQTKSEVQQIVNNVKAHTNPDSSHPKVILSAFIPNLYEGVLGSTGIAIYNSYLSSVSNVDRYFTSNWSSFYDSGTGQAKTSLMADEFHPNATGYSIMADNWYTQVISFL